METLHINPPRKNARAAACTAIIACLGLASAPLFAQAVRPDVPVDDEVVELSRFIVTANDKDDGDYRVKDTLAGTRIRTNLKDVASAISVTNSKFLQDTGSVRAEDLLVYTANTEVGGLMGNYAGAGNAAYLDTAGSRLAPQNNTRVRGLEAADNTRDYFLTDIPWDSYNVGRIDIQRGANNVLFGFGSPAGLINGSVNMASFKDSFVVEGRFGSHSSVRGSFDFNKALLKDELALRAAALYDETKYQQDPAFNRDERYFVAGRYDPKFLRFEGARTSLRVNYEHGNINANRPRVTPPIDAITPWFTQLNKQVYNPTTIGITDPAQIAQLVAAGDRGAGSAMIALDGGISNLKSAGGTYEPWVYVPGEIYQNMIMVFADPRSGASSAIFPGDPDYSRGIGPNGAIDGSITGIPYMTMRGIRNFDSYAQFAQLPNYNLGLYKAKTLSDDSIFDFYNKLLDGPNKREWQNFDAFNIALSQSFLNNRLGIEAIYDWQEYNQGMTGIFSGLSQAVTVDINSHLTDGSPNPNVGRPMVTGHNYGNEDGRTERDTWRFTAFGELNFGDFMDKSSWVTRLLGRHVFTAMYATSQVDTRSRTWARYATDDVYGAQIGVNDYITSQRLLATLNYLGPSLLNASSASGVHIGNLQAIQQPVSGAARFFDSTWAATGVNPGDPWTAPNGSASTQSENPANYAGWRSYQLGIWNSETGDRNRLYRSGSLTRATIDSTVLVWQGYMWDGMIVPLASWRKDKTQSSRVDATREGVLTMRLPDQFEDDNTGESISWGFVVHTPQWITEKMPGRTNVSIFYNRSSNFRPMPGRVDVYGQVLDSPTGNTKDYGFVVNTLNDRLTLKVNWYESNFKNASLEPIGGTWYVGSDVAWTYMYAMQAKNNYGGFSTPYQPGPGQTAAAAAAEQIAAVDAMLSSMPPQQFLDAWHITPQQLAGWQGWVDGYAPSGLTVTGDTQSKGVEIELSAQPIKNLNITFNVAKTTATRMNMAGSFADYIEQRWAVLQGPAGNVRLWDNSYSPSETARQKFETNVYSNYRLARLQEGADVPELRPWRFNIIANYAFDQGWMKGINVGMGYRWQDKIVTGYPIKNNDFDLDNPYHGPTEDAVDFWAGYERQLNKKIKWRIQFNVRNLFQDAHLVPVTVQPDGSPGSSRIAEGMVWTVTNRFEF